MEDLNDKITGETLTAAEFVQPMSELQNVIEQLGQTLTSSDLNQLGKGIAGYVANGTFYIDSGIADAYVLAGVGTKQTATIYTDGFEINFIAGNANTGAATVNVAGLGVKSIKLSGGSNPVAGDVLGRVEAVYDNSNGWFEIKNPAISGGNRVASFAAMRALVSATYANGDVITVTDNNVGGEFVVVNGSVTDNKGTKIVFTDDSSRHCRRVSSSEKWFLLKWFTAVQDCIDAADANDTLILDRSTDFTGVNINKKLNFFGYGRENAITISGAHTLTDTGGNSTWNNFNITSEKTVNGVGGMNYYRCQVNTGAGNTLHTWDHTAGAGGTPQIVEFEQSKFISGKLCESLAAGATYIYHWKEEPLFSFTEADTLTPFAGGFIVLLFDGGLVNINVPQISSASNFQLQILEGAQIDDNTTNVAWRDNNGIGKDLLEISEGVTIKYDNAKRFMRHPPIFEGSGVPSTDTNFQTVPSGALLTFDADIFDEVFYIGTATPLVADQSWVMKAGAGQYSGQSFTLHILGSIDTQGNKVAMFGRDFTPVSQEMKGLTVEGVFDGANWVYGYSDLPEFPVDENSASFDPPNLADGSGTTTTITVTGAVTGSYVQASFSLDTQGIILFAWVSSANTVSVRLQNETGGAINLLSGTLRARVIGFKS